MSRNASLRCAKMQVGMDVDWMDQRVDCIELYRESPTWQGLAVTSRSSTSLPVVGSDSWVRPSQCWSWPYLYALHRYLMPGPRDTQSGQK